MAYKNLVLRGYGGAIRQVITRGYFDLASAASVSVGGDAQNGLNAQEIIDGGATIILTLSNTTWVTAGATFDAERQGIIDGISASSSPTHGWNNEVRDQEVVGSVVRTSDTVVTITLTAAPAYDAGGNEFVTISVPNSAYNETGMNIASFSIFLTAIGTGGRSFMARFTSARFFLRR